MNYLLDTNAVRAMVEDSPGMAAFLERARREKREMKLSVVTLGEVIYGLERLPEGSRKENLRKAVFPFLVGLGLPLPVEREIAEAYGEVKAKMERMGRSMSDNDLWLAATALVERLTLVTKDADFSKIEGIERARWE